MIQRHIKESIDLYVSEGVPPGVFLTAVLSNDLMEALGRADRENRETLYDICGYIYNEIPSACHGSPEKVKGWLDFKKETKHDIPTYKENRN